jgi:hypothetical protein
LDFHIHRCQNGSNHKSSHLILKNPFGKQRPMQSFFCPITKSLSIIGSRYNRLVVFASAANADSPIAHPIIYVSGLWFDRGWKRITAHPLKKILRFQRVRIEKRDLERHTMDEAVQMNLI